MGTPHRVPVLIRRTFGLAKPSSATVAQKQAPVNDAHNDGQMIFV
jgi:hypothetical protein